MNGTGGSALTDADFSVSGTNLIAISSVDHVVGHAEVIVTLAGNLNSTDSSFTISCVAASVFDEDEMEACSSVTAVEVYGLPEDTAGPTVTFVDFLSNTEVAVEFDEMINEATMVSSNFTLASSAVGDTTTITSVEAFGEGVVLTASAASMGFGTGNTVTVSTGVTDVVGNAAIEVTEVILPLLVISEVKLASLTDSSDEFIEIYNPSDTDFDLGSTGAQTVFLHVWDGTDDIEVPLSLFTSSIPASGFFLIGTSQTGGSVSTDATYSTAVADLGSDGAVYLSLSETAITQVIDLVGWGSSFFSEGSAFPAPSAGESIERKALDNSTAAMMATGGEDEFSGNSTDENENSTDFVEQSIPVPQNTSSSTEFAAGEGFNDDGDTELPDVYYSYPSAGVSNIEESLDTIYVLFTETVDEDTLAGDNVSLTASADPATNLLACVYDPYSPYGSFLECAINEASLPLDSAETYTFAISTGVTDLAGNPLIEAYNFEFNVTAGFSLDSSEVPYVTGTHPYNGDVSFDANSSYFYIYFNIEMDTSTLNSANITLFDLTAGEFVSLGAFTSFTSYYTNDAVYIDVSDVEFTAGSEYELVVGTGVQSADEVAMLASDDVIFTVSSDEDLTAPEVVGSSPTDEEIGVFVGTSYFSISIDDVLDTTDVNTDTVKLMNGSDEMDADVSYSSALGVIEVTIEDVLDAYTEYELQLIADPDAAAVTSVTGALLADGDGTADGVHRITFTTGAGDTDSPYISYAMATQSKVYVVFSEGMNDTNVIDVDNYILESPIGTSVSLTALGGATATFDDESYTLIIEGVSLTADDSFTISVADVADGSGNAIDPLYDEASGTVYDEAEYDPGDDTFSDESWDMPSGFDEEDYGYVPQPYAWPSNSLAGFESSYYLYVPITSQIPSDDDSGKIIVTFPAGTDVSGAVNPASSWTNQDVNYDAPGTIEVESMTVDENARTVSVTLSEATTCDDGNVFPCSGTEYDSVSIEIDGIINPTSPRGYDTEGYSVDVQTMDGSTLLESFISYPYYISEAGENSLTVNLTAAGAEDGTATIEAWGYSTGSFSFESADFIGGSATAVMEGVPDGDYWLWTEAFLDLDDDSEDDYLGVASGIYVTVSGDTATEMEFIDIGSLAEVTVNVSGAVGKNVDVSAYGPGWQSEQIESTTGDDDVELRLQDGDWWIYVWPHYDDSIGYVTSDYITPNTVYVNVEDGVVTEDSGTSDDGIIEMPLVAADNAVPFSVVDQDDLPIASAWVWISDINNGFWSYGQTTIDGEVTLNMNAGTFRVGVYVEGLPQSEEHTMTVSEDGEIFMDGSDTAVETVELVARVPSNAISGTVSDGASPVSGASVYAFCTDGCVGNSYSWSMTDTNGAYTFYVDNGTWQVGAYIPGYGYAEEQTVTIADSDQSGVTLQPDPDAVFFTISGTVCEAEEGSIDCSEGEGLGGVYINAWSEEEGGGWNYTTSSADGTYEVRVPAADNYYIEAWDSNLGSWMGLSGLDASAADVTGADVIVVDPVDVTARG